MAFLSLSSCAPGLDPGVDPRIHPLTKDGHDTRERTDESPGYRFLRILIVGAGIGGLTAALALLRDGHEVEVYEQAAQLAELGAGVQISANGARVLFALGLEQALREVWC